jgi:DNA-directed RNA polymerase specialized sigma24 family protein
MAQEPAVLNLSFIPPQSISDDVKAFSERVHGLLDGQPKDDATVARAFDGMDEMFDLIAARLYSMASMLLGEGEDSIRLVEIAIANADASASRDSAEECKSSRRALCAAALDMIEQRNPGTLAAPDDLKPVDTCIEDDDLDAAGESGAELLRMLAGPDRDRVRNWLASLPTVLRTIFVLRAVAGFTPAETAGLLAAHGGPLAAGWTEDAVREFCRQALCSLASQLIQASTAR